MYRVILLILCVVLFFFLKDIISIIISLCILSFCFYYLSTNDYTYIQNIFVSSESESESENKN
jgi:hypothetical protein